jgi:hypothetical protein
MALAPLSSSSIAPSTAERLAGRSMKTARSARPPGARVRRTPATATEGPSVIGAQRTLGPPRPDLVAGFGTRHSRLRLLSRRKTGKRAFFFYESAEVKPPPLTFFFQFGPSAPGVPSTSRSHLRVPRLAVCGEAGNPEAVVPRIPRYLGILMRPPGLCSDSRAFGLMASSGVRPHRVGTTFYPY